MGCPQYKPNNIKTVFMQNIITIINCQLPTQLNSGHDVKTDDDCCLNKYTYKQYSIAIITRKTLVSLKY